VAKIQLPALPQGIGGPDATQLVLQVNDRLRRIALAINDTAASGNGSAAASGGAIELETNGVDNTLQSKLNLIAGTNVTLAADSLGGVSIASAGGGGVGTVTSVALSMPAEFAVGGSPVTAAGTLAVTTATEPANTVWAGPGSGTASAPAFRALAPADLPVATTSALGAVKPDGSTITISGGVITATAPASKLVIGFVINSGAAGTNVGPMLAAPRSASVTKCIVVTKASDATAALMFTIRQNGTAVFSTPPTVAAGTAGGTVSTFTALTSSPLPVGASDVFTLDITAGATAWQFTAQLE
jgi:hypothetical protein